MAVKVTLDPAGKVWVTSSLDDRGPAVRLTVEEWRQALERIRAGEDYPNSGSGDERIIRKGAP